MTKLYLFVRRYLAVLLVFGTLVSFAQQSVSGKVTAADDGSGIPGVNILEKGTSNGTVSDADGNYRINVGANATLVFSFVGYSSQEVNVGSQSSVNVTLQSDVTALSEVVVTGYGTQEKKEITSAVVQLSTKDFNQGNVNDPSQLLQGKVAGLSVYNRGGDPNSSAIVRLRGISTVGANVAPLVVVDGVIGASLDNVDPNDIASINVLKDGSAAAIYGSRGSSGVIIVTTKKGSRKGSGVSLSYNGYAAAATPFNTLPNMTASEYKAAGGNDLGSDTDWQDEVTRTGMSYVNNIAISGSNESTTFRVSTNFRNVEGILIGSGFDQINTRANLTHSAINDKLKLDMNMSLTNRESNFSFNEALRYAALYNPTAPIKFPNGDYYQAILFDNFNPVAILEQNTNTGKRKTMNYNFKADYSILDNLIVTASWAQQYEDNINQQYYSRSSLFRGLGRGGLANKYTSDNKFSLFEAYATYNAEFGKSTLDVTGGYSYQVNQFEEYRIQVGNFPSDELGSNALENAGDILTGRPDRVEISSGLSPENKIEAVFARFNYTFDQGIFVNASVRREGASKLGSDNRYGIFPAAGVGVDFLRYFDIAAMNTLKLRVGYGVTGSLPNDSGLSQDQYGYSFTGGGNVTKTRDGNPDLKWEEKTEINLGVDFGFGKKLSGSLELYTRNISDFILPVAVDKAVFPSGTQTQNAGELKTNGIELALNYDAIQLGAVSWKTGVVLSSYSTELKDFTIKDPSTRAELGAPGQNGTFMTRIAIGEKIGEIWGPVFTGVTSDDPATTGKNEAGSPIFADLNGDGIIKAAPSAALATDGDFQSLGNGIPKMEYGWTNQLNFKNWDLNAFFRGAVGHSLVNNFRAFYEPIDPGAINSYNRIITDKAVDGLTVAQYSSLYVEKASFFKLDNITLGYNFPMQSKAVRNLRAYFSVQNAFVITDYTGIDPEPVLADPGPSDNGGFQPAQPDVLSAGIDRRNSYFQSRTFTFGVNIGFN
jgi:TonB-dependent starch-binding outer membrane protein SusC